jgi:hypothetical protein
MSEYGEMAPKSGEAASVPANDDGSHTIQFTYVAETCNLVADAFR